MYRVLEAVEHLDVEGGSFTSCDLSKTLKRRNLAATYIVQEEK